MYRSAAEFRVDAHACGAHYYADGSLAPRRVEAAYRVYSKALSGTTLANLDGEREGFGVTVVGRLALKDEDGTWVPADEQVPTVDAILRENLGVLDESAGEAGAVLEARDWSLLANDAWLLGGIHANTEFHFASPLTWENCWNAQSGRMTVTAREAIGITGFGYRIVRPTSLEAVAVCANAATAAAASLPAYKARVEACSREAALRRVWEAWPAAARRA